VIDIALIDLIWFISSSAPLLSHSPVEQFGFSNISTVCPITGHIHPTSQHVHWPVRQRLRGGWANSEISDFQTLNNNPTKLQQQSTFSAFNIAPSPAQPTPCRSPGTQRHQLHKVGSVYASRLTYIRSGYRIDIGKPATPPSSQHRPCSNYTHIRTLTQFIVASFLFHPAVSRHWTAGAVWML